MYWLRRCVKWEWPLFVTLVCASLALVIFLALAEDVWTKQAFGFDAIILSTLFGLRSPALTALAQAVTTTGAVPFIAVVLLALTLLWWGRARLDLLAVWVSVLGGALFNEILKTIFARPRPTLEPALVHASGYSFPSGHSTTALAMYGMLAYLLAKRVRPAFRPVIYALAVAWIVLVGLSRNYLAVHFPSDVLAAYAVTLPWLLAVIFAHNCVVTDLPATGRAELHNEGGTRS